MKRFILLSSGRAGSTSLIDALANFDDIAVPNKQINCVDNEIFNPQSINEYAAQYQKISAMKVYDERSLIEAFYKSNSGAAFSGFKSMPNRHQCLHQLASEGNTKLITLSRDDIASTVASFIVAIDRNTWRRKGGKQKHRFVFGPQYEERVVSHLGYIIESQKFFNSLENSIHIQFENLCGKNFLNEELNDFFQRSIKLSNPRPPVSGKAYVSNWAGFTEFVEKKMAEINVERSLKK